MDNIINSVKNSIEQQNWYSALFVALTLPDICTALEHGKTTGARYSQWFESNLSQYNGFLSGNDCYALRCSLLHQGKDDISSQRMQDVLEQYVFLTSGSHCNLFKDCEFNGIKKSFLQLNVATFCNDICIAVETWLQANSDNQSIRERIHNTLEIHEPGYTYLGLIKFG
jgi:hypothetical protein